MVHVKYSRIEICLLNKLKVWYKPYTIGYLDTDYSQNVFLLNYGPVLEGIFMPSALVLKYAY